MKIEFTRRSVLLAVLCISLLHVQGQPGQGIGLGVNAQPGPSQSLSGSMKKIFGKHTAFTANVEMQFKREADKVIMPGKMVVLDDKVRFELDMAEIKGGGIPPDAAATMKQMGMDKTVTITRPDKQALYIIYPALRAYVAQSFKDPEASRPESDFKAEVTELGKETVEGRACMKNKVVVTDKEDRKHEFTVWNAAELDNFPVRIEVADNASTVTWLYKEVKLGKPDPALFNPPDDYKKYDSIMALMQEQLMKQVEKGSKTTK